MRGARRLFVYLSICLLSAPAYAATPNVTCARCIVVDENGSVLWARNPRDRFPNASTTKMVTALLVARAAEPDDAVTVSPTAGAVGGGGLDLAAGETYTVDALMYAMLLDSSNEAAQALAEHVAGTGERFVARMNRYVRAIGATRTHFANPHGLDSEGHYASAADLATIGAEVLADPYLARIVATHEATIPTPRGPVTLENRNLLLESYPGAIGIKTGRTLGAGNVLVAAARRGSHTLIAVAMYSYDSFADSAALLDFGFATLRRLDRNATLLAEGAVVGELVFDSGAIPVVADDDVTGPMPPDADDIVVTITAAERLELPIEEGDPVGRVEVRTPDGAAGTVTARAGAAVPDDGGPWWSAPIVGLVRALGSLVGAA